MDISKVFKSFKGVILVEVEGFFIERFINLCSINNINIWDIETTRNGNICIKTDKKNFKNVKKMAKKTKCTAKIKKKKGMYFLLFRYRKRRISVVIAGIMLLALIVLSTFVLRIDIKGNEKIGSKEIEESFKKAGLYIGKSTFFISKRKVIDYVRADIEELAWVGVELKGTTARITVVEKIKSEENLDKDIKGDIIVSDSGVITKIIAESGTTKYTTGSYITKGAIAIAGIVESKFLETEYVRAIGVVKIKKDEVFKQSVKYEEEVKEYTGKYRHGIGTYIKNKKYELKYLPKDRKYDISIDVKKVKVLGKEFVYEIYKYREYNTNKVKRSYEEALGILKQRQIEYEKSLADKKLKILSNMDEVKKLNDGVEHTVVYTVEKDVGEFVATRK